MFVVKQPNFYQFEINAQTLSILFLIKFYYYEETIKNVFKLFFNVLFASQFYIALIKLYICIITILL